MPGDMITANVRLVRPLAAGGMGTVWLADHLGLETEVAVKLIHAELIEQYPVLIERFRREAALSARVRSVHVVQVFDYGTTDNGTPFIVMERLDGETLDQLLEREGALDLSATSRVVSQLAKVLHSAHVLGVVHRDVKPDNVFLVAEDYDRFVKLLDFGVAKRSFSGGRAEVTRTGIGIGTPGYISPEQAINAKKVDHRADLWALAAVAYRMLTGKLPFDDDGAPGPWWVRAVRRELVPATTYAPELPAAIDAWFARALHPDPAERFQSAAEMATALAGIAAEQPADDGAERARSARRSRSSQVTVPVFFDDDDRGPERQAPEDEEEPTAIHVRSSPPPTPPRPERDWVTPLVFLGTAALGTLIGVLVAHVL
jgi:eukaryotic-like serine/threonine-protein kinase